MVNEMSGAGADGEPITEEGIAALREEIEQLEGPGRTEMAARIKAARELGDLKENAEYHIAKEDQAHLETRIKRLRERLRTAVVVEVDGGGDRFAFGRTAEVLDEGKGAVNTWTLVGSTEADLAAGRSRPSRRSARRCSTPSRASRSSRDPRGSRTFVVQKLLD
jgi:transcription elongation factor GreA